jgi:hypothetical protein
MWKNQASKRKEESEVGKGSKNRGRQLKAATNNLQPEEFHKLLIVSVVKLHSRSTKLHFVMNDFLTTLDSRAVFQIGCRQFNVKPSLPLAQ